MRNINLIPRKSYVEKRFIPLVSIAATLSFTIAGSLLFTIYQYDTSITEKVQQKNELQTRIQQLTALRTTDAATADYNRLAEDVRKVKESRNNWKPVFEFLSSSVPSRSRITSIEAAEQQKMALNMEFADLKQVADYVAQLQQSSLFSQVTVMSVQKAEKGIPTEQTAAELVKPAAGAGSTPSTSTSPTSAAAANPANQQKNVTKEQYIQELEKQSEASMNPSDQLLNEMNWVIQQQLSKQQLGIELPDKTFTPSSGAERLSSDPLFSQEELEAAQKSLTELKRTKIVAETSQASENVVETKPAPTVTVYQVVLQLDLMKPTPKK